MGAIKQPLWVSRGRPLGESAASDGWEGRGRYLVPEALEDGWFVQMCHQI